MVFQFLPTKQLFFTSSSVTTQPDVDFVLPQDPNEDSGGVNRKVTYSFDGQVLKVKGSVDSRAFDGPLIDYTFVAKVDKNAGEKTSYFTARPDFRKCASPMCGGYFVKTVNKKLTQCADGTRRPECYVASINYAGGPLDTQNTFSNSTPLLLVGGIEPKEFASFGKLGVFSAIAAYQSATQVSASGHFFGIENNGIVCITSPCFSFDQSLLNAHTPIRKLSQVNLAETGASATAIEAANTLLAEGEVLPATGKNRKYQGFAGTGVEFVAQQFYLPIKPAVVCEKGYEYAKGSCRTPYGCAYPELELTGHGGVPIIDPITGEITPNISKSCVSECKSPGILTGPGQCAVYYP